MSELKEMGIIEIEATGKIILTRHDDKNNSESITAKWKGGDIVAFSQELLKEANPVWLHRYPGAIQCCQFRLEIIGETESCVYARRIS